MTRTSFNFGSARGAFETQRLRRLSQHCQHLILLLLHLAAVLPQISAFGSSSIVCTRSSRHRHSLNMFAGGYRRCVTACGRLVPVSKHHIIRSKDSYSYVTPAAPTSSSRLFGTKRNTPGNPPGEISIYNEQTALDQINIDRLEATIREIRNIVNYPTYDISLLLVDDEEMRQTNLDTRGIDGPTDILSFPFQDVAVKGKPGELAEPEFDIEDYYSLGDMMLDVAYVMRRCEEDRRAAAGPAGDDTDAEQVIVEGAENDAESDHVDDDRGVSGAMSTVYDPEERIHFLLVHGMLHLVGYDHIDDGDYDLMWRKEEEVLNLLRSKGILR